MINRRTLVVPIVVVAAALAALLLFKLTGPGPGDEGGETEADMAVHVGKITRATLHRTVTAYGVVEPEPGDAGRPPADSEVASPVAGIVAHIACVEGRKVAKGDVLFRLDSRVAEVLVEKARQALEFAERNFERQEKLLPVEGTSRKAYQEAEQQLNAARTDLAAAETGLALLVIRAPLDGTVVKINTEPGEAVELNTVLAVIIDLDRLVVSVNVPSAEAAQVVTGQTSELEGGPVGKVIYVASRIVEGTGTVPVRVSVPAGSGLRPGHFLGVRIVSGIHRDVLAVPEAAVIFDTVAGEAGRIVLVEGDTAVFRPVRTGYREGGLVEVESEGLKDGTVIVTVDAYAVPDGTKIHVIG
jgi:membrane fusion protein (multidrug efflux system)